jgi:hypothetical protein
MLAKLEENRLNDVALPYGRRYKKLPTLRQVCEVEVGRNKRLLSRNRSLSSR